MTSKKTAKIFIKSVTLFAIGFISFMQLLIRNDDIMTTYYVSTSGNNSNIGTSSTPLKSIQEAIDRANAGDTILVKAGAYNSVRFDNKNGTKSQPITLAAAPGDEGKVYISSGKYDSGKGVHIINSSNIIVEDLNVNKSLFGIRVEESKNITLQGNKVYDIGQEAIHARKNSSHINILNNTIFDTGNRFGRYAEGIYIGSVSKPGDRTNNILIKGNDISKTMEEGIDIKPYVSNVIIEDNRIHDIKTGRSGALVIGLQQGNYEGGNFSNVDNVIVRNNKIWNISTSTKWKDGNAIRASSGATIYNNVIWNYEHRGIFIHRAPNNNEFKVYHNTVYPADGLGSEGDIVISKTNAEVDIQNNIGFEGGNNISGTEKLFVNADGDNFRLVSSAPAVDAGIKLSEVKTDLDGYFRIQNKAPDLGAYEYGSSSPKPELPPEIENQTRVQDGLAVLYTFDAGEGNTVFDVSDGDNPLNLTIDNPQNVTWGDGTLTVDAATVISSQNPATKINQALIQSNELTIEAWVIAENETQSGPARIVTLSSDVANRHFTLGQKQDSYDIRLRTTITGNNGNNPSLSSPVGIVDEDELTHIVYTRDKKGIANLYLDNELVASEMIAGDFSNWNLDYELGLANELSGYRPWIGTYDLVAVYDQALSSQEVTQNFLSGPNNHDISDF